MDNYQCKKCKKEFKNKYLLKRHHDRTRDCVTGNRTNNNGFKCKECNCVFNRLDSLKRHNGTKRCESNKEKMIKQKTKRNKEIKNMKNVKNVDNNVIKGDKNIDGNITKGNKNIVMNKSICVNLIVFAKDGISSLDSKEYKKIFGSKNNMIEELTKLINLNPDKPQHHNILYPDMKSSYGEVYENNTWIKKKIDEILETLIDAKIDDLNEILEDMGDFLDEKTQQKIKETIEKMDYTKPGSRKKLRSYLKPILYNHKDMIIKTRKLTKEQIDDIARREQQEAENEALEEEKLFKQKKKLEKKLFKKKYDNDE